MDVQNSRRTPCWPLLLLFFASSSPALAATLAGFTFDSPSGEFVTEAATLDAAIDLAAWTDEQSKVTGFSGNPGRALATSRFQDGNRLILTLLSFSADLRLEQLLFDVRASASGPQDLLIEINDLAQASLNVTTSFISHSVDLTLLPDSTLSIAFRGLNATSNAGTLRLDNVVIVGQVVPVPLPGMGLATALSLASLGVWRRRPRPFAPAV
ncbi:MAG: hypothetical protein AAF384_03910 [Pseudomonadota bacterium]